MLTAYPCPQYKKKCMELGVNYFFDKLTGIPKVSQTLRELEQLLKPSRDLETLGELGIFNVVKEHCGVEIQIIGRHPYWNVLWEQYRKVISILLEKRARMGPTCGLHFHLIDVGLSETIPEIILANLWNLVRRHAPGLNFYSAEETFVKVSAVGVSIILTRSL